MQQCARSSYLQRHPTWSYSYNRPFYGKGWKASLTKWPILRLYSRLCCWLQRPFADAQGAVSPPRYGSPSVHRHTSTAFRSPPGDLERRSAHIPSGCAAALEQTQNRSAVAGLRCICPDRRLLPNPLCLLSHFYLFFVCLYVNRFRVLPCPSEVLQIG